MEESSEATIPFMLNGRCISSFSLVSPDIEKVMLGADWLRNHNCIWDFGRGQLYIDGRAAVPLARKQHLRCRRVYVQENVVLPPRQQMDVKARSTLLSPVRVGADWIVESHQVRPGLYVGRTLLPDAHRDLNVRMEPQTLTGGICFGNLCPVEG